MGQVGGEGHPGPSRWGNGFQYVFIHRIVPNFSPDGLRFRALTREGTWSSAPVSFRPSLFFP